MDLLLDSEMIHCSVVQLYIDKLSFYSYTKIVSERQSTQKAFLHIPLQDSAGDLWRPGRHLRFLG